MPNFPATTVQTAFASGELSPRLRGRTDIEQYFRGVARLRNFLVQKHGGLAKRPGTRFIANGKVNGDRIRLVKFDFNDDQQYVLEYGNGYIRFFRYDTEDGSPIQLIDIGDVPTEISTSYPELDLPELKFTQSADVQVITHTEHPPRTLTRVDADDVLASSWAHGAISFVDGPYLPINATSTTITPSATTGTVTLTASAPIFAATDVSVRWVRLLHGAIWGWARVSAFTSATVVDALVFSPFGGTSATVNWRLGVFDGIPGNWPSVAVFHQGRLWLAASNSEPQTLWGSVTGNYFTFSPSQPDGTVLATSALNLSIDDDQVNAIRWMLSDRVGLVILTGGGEFVLSAGEDRPITPTDVSIRRQSTYGANNLSRPAQIGPSIIFWQGSRKLRELAYSIENDRLGGPDLAILSEHIGQPGLGETAYSELPDSFLWTVLNNGTVACTSLEREQKVAAWHVHEFTEGFVESVAVIRNPLTQNDQLWLSIQRTVNLTPKRFIEVMQDQFDFNQDHKDAWFVDCGLNYSGSPVLTLSGLDHLEGETVTMLGDGATYPPAVVTGGAISFSPAVSKAVVGFGITSDMETMPLAPPAPYEPRGKLRRATKMMLQMWRSLGGEVAPSLTTSDPLIYRTPGIPMNQQTPLFTGIKEMAIDQSAGLEVTVRFVHTEPQPFTLLAMFTEVDLGG